MKKKNSASTAGPVIVIGAGPAGLTAALELVESDRQVTVLESEDSVGGISRTVERDGWRFDIGGHRFFTKVPEVEERWKALLEPKDFPRRSRLSRIYYNGKFFDYPLKAKNALLNLGVLEATRSVASYAVAQVRPPKDQDCFEGWVSARFGRRLYEIFFESYTEKVWGIHPSKLPSDWAAQRIKNLSLGRAVLDSFRGTKGRRDVASLIDEFDYPTLGPGMMWTAAQEQVLSLGGKVIFNSEVVAIEHENGIAATVVTTTGRYEADGGVISSMPLGELVEALRPPPPDSVVEAARSLGHRDFMTVAVVVPSEGAFKDNWIYIHSKDVLVGRVQNFRSWSPDMVKEGFTCLGLEYFLNEGDELWETKDEDLVELARRELDKLGLAPYCDSGEGWVVRMPKAYPIYELGYAETLETIRNWFDETSSNIIPVGRNGMHRYNNQDHSMKTAMLAVENLAGSEHDIWAVNVEEDYHEEKPLN